MTSLGQEELTAVVIGLQHDPTLPVHKLQEASCGQRQRARRLQPWRTNEGNGTRRST